MQLLRFLLHVCNLLNQGDKLSLTACTLDWYRLPDEKARELILIIAMSNIPTKIQAGKFIDLSIKTFGDVSNMFNGN